MLCCSFAELELLHIDEFIDELLNQDSVYVYTGFKRRDSKSITFPFPTLLYQTIPGARGARAVHPYPRAIVTPSTPVASLAATKMAIRLRKRTIKRRVRAEAKEALKRQKRLDRPTNLEPN